MAKHFRQTFPACGTADINLESGKLMSFSHSCMEQQQVCIETEQYVQTSANGYSMRNPDSLL